MTNYKILSPRVGEVGADFTPDEGVNIDALIDNGFISADKQTAKKSDKTEPTTEKE